jgi:hypothetical protein
VDTELPAESSPEPQPASEIAPAIASVAAVAAPISAAPTYRDRSTGLVIFGVAQIVLGLMAALMVPFAALGAFMSRLTPGGGMRPGQYLSGISVYAFAAAVLLALGIGSVQSKRWAHALTLVISWYWLVNGVLVTVLMTAVLPVAVRSVLQAQQDVAGTPSPQISTGVMAVILTIIIVFAAFFLVVAPIAFVVFYSRKDVAETCRHRDPVSRWTNRTPLPVLGASVVLAVQAAYLLLTGFTTPLFPFFGQYLYGIAGVACFMAVAALDVCLAVALFHLKSAGWWIAIVTVPLRLLSMVLTYARADMMQAYSKMGMSEQQLRMLNSSPLFRGHVLLWWSLLSMVILYGYLLWLKRYFRVPATRPQADALPAQVS